MKKTKNLLSYLCALSTICAVFGISTFAQSFEKGGKSLAPTFAKSSTSVPTSSNIGNSVMTAPFDFSDKNYTNGGIDVDYILERRNGEDRLSVFDNSSNWLYADIRVTATKPAYDQDGNRMLFNQFGDLRRDAFINDDIGIGSFKRAASNPIYEFPSELYVGSERQAAMIDMRNDHNGTANPLGLRVVCYVTFTLENMTPEDAGLIEDMKERFGVTIDGTPVIKTTSDMMDLVYRQLVKIEMRGHGNYAIPSYTIAPVIYDPTGGMITPDAFIMIVRQSNGKALPSEELFEDDFNCLQASGQYCPAN